MTTITIPRELTRKGELGVIPRKEYDEFSYWKKLMKSWKTFTPTSAQKKQLRQARNDYKAGRSMSIYELKRKLGIKS